MPRKLFSRLFYCFSYLVILVIKILTYFAQFILIILHNHRLYLFIFSSLIRSNAKKFNGAVALMQISHYGDVIMGEIASQITSLAIVYSTVYADVDQRKHQRSASLAFVRGIHRGPVNSPHKWPVTRKMFPFDDVIMRCYSLSSNHLDFNMFNLWIPQYPIPW